MTRKYFLLFIILFFCSYFLLSGILGENGLMAYSQLSDELNEHISVLKKIKLAQTNLEKQKEAIYSEEFLKDQAIKLGYSGQNDEVYFFEPENMDLSAQKLYDLKKIQAESEKIRFFSRKTIFLISFLFSFFLTLVFALVSNGVKKTEPGVKSGTEQK